MTIIHTDEFIRATTLRSQIGILCNALRSNEIHMTYRKIGQMFNCNSGIIKYQEQRYQSSILSIGRPSELNEEEISYIKSEILDRIQIREPETIDNL